MLNNLTILSWTVTKVLGDMPEVFSFVQEIEEPSQKCDLCKKVMKIFADELDKDDVSFQNFNLFYLFHILSSILLLPNCLWESKEYCTSKWFKWLGFFYIWLRIIHGTFYLIRLGQGSSLHRRHLPSPSKPNKQRCKSAQIKRNLFTTVQLICQQTCVLFLFLSCSV